MTVTLLLVSTQSHKPRAHKKVDLRRIVISNPTQSPAPALFPTQGGPQACQGRAWTEAPGLAGLRLPAALPGCPSEAAVLGRPKQKEAPKTNQTKPLLPVGASKTTAVMLNLTVDERGRAESSRIHLC